MDDLEALVKGTVSCWVATRINGHSAAMACSGGEVIDIPLLKYLDKRYGDLLRPACQKCGGTGDQAWRCDVTGCEADHTCIHCEGTGKK